MNSFHRFLALAALGCLATPLSGAAGLASLRADRTALERVYHAHRTGAKPPFEEALPPTPIEKLVNADAHKEAKHYFEDLPARLRELLSIQLRQPGDVSAVVELPTAFQLYLARERSPERLSVAVLTLAKTSYEAWLARQPE